ncbi:MAG: glycoside hydrolase family 16 protein [Bacteroidota bacterium]
MNTRRSISLLCCLAFVGLFWSCEQSDPPVKEWTLVWADEFTGNELDDEKWEIQTGDGSQYGLWRWGNNEEQWYLGDNASVSNGSLKIKAQAETVGDYEYTSARIRSLNKGDFKYGRVEAAIRMANTPGLWHAFWMLPSEPPVSWPASGEIDVMEYVGNQPDEIFTTMHFADQWGNHNQLGMLHPHIQDNQYHQYAVEWDENQVVWFTDSVEVFKVLRSNDAINATWPFDAEFHLLINTAVGGNLGGTVDAQALQLPRFMEVDYVRVYQNQ